ncbi:MAG: putative Ig domain-containing protein [Candidatus Krumholzibacteriota bacterium]|nr:putative Ig domain-containing protein [Candidatus Krumholzibacteriota bacterium]
MTSEGLTISLDAGATPTTVATLIAAIGYDNAAGDTPTGGDRTIRVTVDDGTTAGAGDPADVTVQVAAVNDADRNRCAGHDHRDRGRRRQHRPDRARPGRRRRRGQPDRPHPRASTRARSRRAGGGGVTVGGTGTGTLTLTGSAANLNAFLGDATAVQYTSAANANGTGAATLTFTLNDQGNTGSGGGTNVALGSAQIDIAAVNDAPTVANAPADQTTAADRSFSYRNCRPAPSPTSTAATASTYTATSAGGGALPSWLTFDAATRTFSGTPGEGEVGTDQPAGDGRRPVEHHGDDHLRPDRDRTAAPTVASAPVDQTATAGDAFSYQLPANTFADPDAGATLLRCRPRSASGASLPAWLSFDAATRTFSGTPGDGDTGTLSLRVTAQDGAGATATASFELSVEAAEGDDDPVPPPSDGDDDDDPVTPTVTTLDRGPVRVTVIEIGGENVLVANSGVVSGRAFEAILGTFDRGNSPLAQTFRAAAANLSGEPSETLQTALGDSTTRGILADIEAIGGETLIFQNGEWRPLDLETCCRARP